MVACVVQYGETGQRSLQTMRELLSNAEELVMDWIIVALVVLLIASPDKDE